MLYSVVDHEMKKNENKINHLLTHRRPLRPYELILVVGFILFFLLVGFILSSFCWVLVHIVWVPKGC